MIIAERSSLEGTRGRLDTCVIVVKLQMQTRAIQTQIRNKNVFFALHRSRSSGKMPWAWQQNKVICDVCQESLMLNPHPPAQWCNAKHTAWACKVSEINHKKKVVAWVCIGCAYTCDCLLYTSPSPRDRTRSRMPSSA